MSTTEWFTPPAVVAAALRLWGAIDLDPCSNEGAPNVPARRHFTRRDDGLTQPWAGSVFLNPPYNNTAAWVEKLLAEYQAGRVREALALLPASVETAWAARLAEWPRCHIRGRLRFSGATVNAPFSSMVVYVGPSDQQFAAVFRGLGDVYALAAPMLTESRPAQPDLLSAIFQGVNHD